jgi:hypothetical protein
LDEASEVFKLSKCSFNNEKYKRNAARLGVYRDFKLVNSYTIESSCYGFDVKISAYQKALNQAKQTAEDEEAPQEKIQFTIDHFLKFGETLGI